MSACHGGKAHFAPQFDGRLCDLLHQAQPRRQQRGLAGAGLAHDGNQAALWDVQLDALQARGCILLPGKVPLNLDSRLTCTTSINLVARSQEVRSCLCTTDSLCTVILRGRPGEKRSCERGEAEKAEVVV